MDDLETPTIYTVGKIVKSGIPVMVYRYYMLVYKWLWLLPYTVIGLKSLSTCYDSGDQDSVIPFTGTRNLVYKLAKALGLKTTVPYRPWFEGKQVS